MSLYRKILLLPALCLFVLFCEQSQAQSPTTVALEMNQSMSTGTQIFSPNGRYFLAFQQDGNLVVYRKDSSNVVAIWSANTQNKGATQVILQGDGNFVVYRGAPVKFNALWASRTVSSGVQSATVTIGDRGNLTININGKFKWNTPEDPAAPPVGPTCFNNQPPAMFNVCVNPGIVGQYTTMTIACSGPEALRQVGGYAILGTCL